MWDSPKKGLSMQSLQKKAAAALLATGMTCSLVACSGGGDNASASGNGSGGSITWDMWGGSDDDLDWISQTADIVRKQNPDIELKTQTSAWSDYFTKLTSNMSSGNLACITSMNGQRLSGFYQALSPLTDEDLEKAGIKKEDFTDGALDIMTFNDNLYGIPYDVSAMMVFYNKDMFAETGAKEPTLDWTFDDFNEAAKKTTTDQHKGFGIGMGEFQWMALPIALSGTQPVTADGNIDLTNPDFVKAAEWYADLVLTEKVADPVPSASEAGWGEEQYQNGNVAMAVDGTWNAYGYFNNEAGFKAGATRLPQGDNGSLGLILGSGFGISANCDNRDAALKVLGSLVSKEAQDLLSSSGRSYPSRIESQAQYFDSFDEAVREEVKAAFDAAFKDQQGQNSAPVWSQVSNYIQPNLVSVYTGQTPMSQMLEQAQAQFGNK